MKISPCAPAIALVAAAAIVALLIGGVTLRVNPTWSIAGLGDRVALQAALAAEKDKNAEAERQAKVAWEYKARAEAALVVHHKDYEKACLPPDSQTLVFDEAGVRCEVERGQRLYIPPRLLSGGEAGYRVSLNKAGTKPLQGITGSWEVAGCLLSLRQGGVWKAPNRAVQIRLVRDGSERTRITAITAGIPSAVCDAPPPKGKIAPTRALGPGPLSEQLRGPA